MKARTDVHVGLFDTRGNDNSIEVVIAGWGNTKSVLRASHQGAALDEVQHSPLDENAYRWFWLSWADSVVRVGTGMEHQPHSRQTPFALPTNSIRAPDKL